MLVSKQFHTSFMVMYKQVASRCYSVVLQIIVSCGASNLPIALLRLSYFISFNVYKDRARVSPYLCLLC